MEITNPDQLTGPVIREMREKAGLTQQQFWGPFGVGKSRASAYETGEHRIDRPAQLLVYLNHICGFPIGLPHSAMLVAGLIAGASGNAAKEIGQAAASIETAVGKLNQARQKLEEI